MTSRLTESYGLKRYVKDYEDVITLKDEIMTSLFLAAEQKDLTIPFPKQEINISMKKT